MSLLIGRARAGNLTTPRQIWRWNAQTFMSFQGHPVQPAPDRRSEWTSKKFQAHAWEASALREHETPKLRAGRSLAPGPYGGGATPGSRFGQRCCSLPSVWAQHGRYTHSIVLYVRGLTGGNPGQPNKPPTRTHPAVIVPATKVTTTTGEVIL